MGSGGVTAERPGQVLVAICGLRRGGGGPVVPVGSGISRLFRVCDLLLRARECLIRGELVAS